MQTSAGPITIELDPARAPVTVANFVQHAQAGDYDGTVFHRVVPEFVVQGGGWTPLLQERAKLAATPDTPIVNEWTNGLKNAKGTIAMAREQAPDTATREFYFNLKDNVKLDSARPTTGNAGYAVFGRVVDGWKVVETIAAGQTTSRDVPGVTDGSMNNVPVSPVVIQRVRVRPAGRDGT
jgi:peptidyl-prolyl cis-trans isomerase A (cyclophilin A)